MMIRLVLLTLVAGLATVFAAATENPMGYRFGDKVMLRGFFSRCTGIIKAPAFDGRYEVELKCKAADFEVYTLTERLVATDLIPFKDK